MSPGNPLEIIPADLLETLLKLILMALGLRGHTRPSTLVQINNTRCSFKTKIYQLFSEFRQGNDESFMLCPWQFCIQCFDTVGWASGRASSL